MANESITQLSTADIKTMLDVAVKRLALEMENKDNQEAGLWASVITGFQAELNRRILSHF